MSKFKYIPALVAGVVAGTANGFFGGGGGMLLVPLLTDYCKLEDVKTFPTSISIILPLCLFSSGIYWFRGDLDFALALPYLIGGGLGGILAGKWFKSMDVGKLRKLFALLLLFSGVKSLLF